MPPPNKPQVTPDQLLVQGVSEHQAGRLDAAERLYAQILEVDVRHADALHLLGLVQQQRGRPGEAIPLIRQALELSPDEGLYHANLAEAYRSVGNLELAELHGRRALTLEPTQGEAHNTLGLVAELRGHYEESARHYEAAIEQRPFVALPYDNLARVLRTQGRLYEALAFLTEGMRLNPGAEPLLASLSALRRELGAASESAD